MLSSAVSRTISRSNRNLLILSIAGLAGLILFGALTYRYYYSFFAGPYQIPREELLAAQDADEIFRYYVTVDGDDMADTGFERETRRNGVVTSTRNYLALLIDDRVLLVETPDLIGTSFTGSLIDFPSDVRNEIIAEIEADYPELEGVFLPMMLRDDDFRISGYLGLALAAALLLFSLFGIFNVMGRMSDPSRHPIMRGLARFGDARLAASEIDAHLAGEHPRVGNVHLTPAWMVHTTGAFFEATRYDDLVWVYKQVTQRRVNGIPTGKTFAAMICDRHGKVLTVQCKEEQVNQILTGLLQRAPWALAGHSSELEEAWKKNRAAMVGAVDQRHQQVLSGAR